MPAMWARPCVCHGDRPPVEVRGVSPSSLADRRDDSAQHEDPADPLVLFCTTTRLDGF